MSGLSVALISLIQPTLLYLIQVRERERERNTIMEYWFYGEKIWKKQQLFCAITTSTCCVYCIAASFTENECLELRVIKCQAEGGRLSQTKVRATDDIISYKSGTSYKIMPWLPILDFVAVSCYRGRSVSRVWVTDWSQRQAVIGYHWWRCSQHYRECYKVNKIIDVVRMMNQSDQFSSSTNSQHKFSYSITTCCFLQ